MSPETAVRISLPDGSRRELRAGTTGADLAAEIGPGLAKAALAVEADGVVRDLDQPLRDGEAVSIVTDRSDEGLEMLRHSTAHVMAQAVMDVFGRDVVRLGIGPTIKHGFYYDFDIAGGRPIRDVDLEAIEARMREIIEEDQRFVREEVPRDEALATWSARGDRYKCELIEGFPENEPISFYHQEGRGGEEAFVDLCRGPHVPSTGRLKVHFKLLNVSGAYWRGKADNPMMQRIYAACFRTRKELDGHLRNLERAKENDHRKLGRELKLFHFTDEVGPGLPLWLPRGTAVLEELEGFLRDAQRRAGYQPVATPHIGRVGLYRTSGHWQNYRDSMFPMIGDEESEGFCLKPMNCPHHIHIYKSELRSYRDLPLRLSEFGTVYRYEQSGELGGLKRARAFTVDDAHLFVTPEQLPDELVKVVQLVQRVLGVLGLSVQARVGTRDPSEAKYVGDDALWAEAEQAVVDACRRMGLEHAVEPGEAAFYGPKLDFVVTDSLDREWQLGTAQVDYNLPERFDLLYTGADGRRHRPIMIHRAPFGSLERLMGVLIEHVGGRFPLWLAPVQVAVAPISDDQREAAAGLVETLRGEAFRVEPLFQNEPIGAKIKRARVERIPYVAIMGAREIEQDAVSVRSRDAGDLGAVSRADFLAKLREEREQRT